MTIAYRNLYDTFTPNAIREARQHYKRRGGLSNNQERTLHRIIGSPYGKNYKGPIEEETLNLISHHVALYAITRRFLKPENHQAEEFYESAKPLIRELARAEKAEELLQQCEKGAAIPHEGLETPPKRWKR